MVKLSPSTDLWHMYMMMTVNVRINPLLKTKEFPLFSFFFPLPLFTLNVRENIQNGYPNYLARASPTSPTTQTPVAEYTSPNSNPYIFNPLSRGCNLLCTELQIHARLLPSNSCTIWKNHTCNTPADVLGRGSHPMG